MLKTVVPMSYALRYVVEPAAELSRSRHCLKASMEGAEHLLFVV